MTPKGPELLSPAGPPEAFKRKVCLHYSEGKLGKGASATEFLWAPSLSVMPLRITLRARETGQINKWKRNSSSGYDFFWQKN